MTNVYTVTFDIADGSFEFYSKEAWKVTGWKYLLIHPLRRHRIDLTNHE